MKKLIIPLIVLNTVCASVSQANTDRFISTKIVNGTETSIQTFPDFVSLFYDRRGYDDRSGSHSYCGGTLLNSQYVLTAAHCIYSGTELNKDYLLYYSVGQTDTDDESTLSTIETVRPAAYYVTDFTNSVYQLWPNDIAIIQLASPLNISGTVSRLNDDTAYRNAESKFITIGHGNTKLGTSTDILYETSLNYLNNDTCKTSFNEFFAASGFPTLGEQIQDAQLCFSGETGSSVSDYDGLPLRNGICSGDSGGPVYWERGSGDFVQVGITSFGPTDCGNGFGSADVTGVFTEVADYSDWIDRVIAGEETPVYVVTDAKRACYFQTDGESDECDTGDDTPADDTAGDTSDNVPSGSSSESVADPGIAPKASGSSGGSVGSFVFLLCFGGLTIPRLRRK